MLYQLARTNIALSGNVKICCHVSRTGLDSMKLRPIIYHTPVYGMDIVPSQSSFSSDIVNFYNTYSDVFYKPPISSYLDTDYLLNNTILTNDIYRSSRISKHEYGVERCSRQIEGNQFCVFAPIFMSDISSIPDYAKIKIQQIDTTGSKMYPEFSFNVDIGWTKTGDIYKYLKNTFDSDFTTDSTIRMMNISPDSTESLLIGRSVISGELTSLKSDLPVTLFTNDLTLTEFNSRIVDEYNKYNMICPYFINLAFYLDIDNISPNISKFFTKGNSFKIDVDYYKDSNKVEVCDIDFNHEFISCKEDISNVTYNDNVLNYTHEYEIDNIYNYPRQKLIPYINKWVLTNSDDTYVFNTYSGFNNFVDPLTGDEVTHDGANNTIYANNFRTIIPESTSYNLEWFDFVGDANVTSDNINSYIEGKLVNELVLDTNTTSFNRHSITDNIAIINGVKYTINDISVDYNTSGVDYNYIYKISNDSKISINFLASSTEVDETNKINKKLTYITPYDHEPLDTEFTIKYLDIFIYDYNITNDDDKYIGDKFNEYILSKLVESVLMDTDVYSYNISFGRISDATGSNVYTYNTSESLFVLGTNMLLETPHNIYINTPLSCSYIVSGDEYIKSLIRQNDTSNIYINRYSGWISPRFIPVENYNASDINLIFNKNRIESDSEEIYNCVDVSGNGVLYSDKTTYIGTGNYQESPWDIWSNRDNIEGKWFWGSRVLHTPYTISFSYPCTTNKEYSLTEICTEYIGELLGIEDHNNLLYIYNLYNVSLDSSDNDLLITMTIK